MTRPAYYYYYYDDLLCSLLWPNSYGGILPLTTTSYVAYALQLWICRSGAASGCAQATLGRPSRSRTVRWRGRGWSRHDALLRRQPVRGHHATARHRYGHLPSPTPTLTPTLTPTPAPALTPTLTLSLTPTPSLALEGARLFVTTPEEGPRATQLTATLVCIALCDVSRARGRATATATARGSITGSL